MAILYGTQSNGETLPVLVDQFGNLLAKGIDGNPGQEGPEGPPGQNGQPGTPGEGVPLPYGDEGSYLQIVSGAPAWTQGPGPGPTPPADNWSWTNIETTSNCKDQNGNPVDPPDPLAYLSGLSSWLTTGVYEKAGSTHEARTKDDPEKELNFDFENSFGKVIKLYLDISYNCLNSSPQTWNNTYEWSDSNIFLVNAVGPEQTTGIQGELQYASWVVAFTVNREVLNASLSWIFSGPYTQTTAVWFRGIELVDAGSFALGRQMVLESQIRALRGMTTGIDLSRPTQD